ncbi:MAG: hypothetical protein AABY64_07790 [Bdellovibrionota bacterium]
MSDTRLIKLILSILVLTFMGTSPAVSSGVRESSQNSNHRTTRDGVIFTLDTSNIALGEAYRDPSGLIWGSIVTANGKINHMSQRDANKYCNAGNARLPTYEEFVQLAKYLGYGTAQGYSPYQADGKTDLLPGLSGYWFWSISFIPNADSSGYVFNGNTGVIDYGALVSSGCAFRCVNKRGIEK